MKALEAGIRVGRNTAFRAGAQALSALVNVAGMLLLGRHLSASGYGEYAFYYALIPLIASVCDVGAGVVVTREMARSRADAARTLGDGLVVRAIVGGLLLVAGLGFGLALAPAHAWLVLLVTAAGVLDFGQDPAVWAFRASERLDLESALLLVSQLAWLAGLALALRLGGSIEALIGVAAAAFLLRTLAGLALLSRLGHSPRFAPAAARIGRLVSEGWPIGLALLLVVLYGRVGVFALKLWSGAAQVACFNVAYLLSQPLGFLASALSIAAFPAFARLRAGERADIEKPLRSAFQYQLLLALPIGAALLLLADRVVPLLFHASAGYAAAGAALRVMALAIPCVFLNLHSRYLLSALGRQRSYLVAMALGLAVNVIGCAATARAFGALGAAWTFVAAETVVFVFCQRALAAELSVRTLVSRAWRPLVAASLMGAAMFAARAGGLALEVAVGVLAYPAALVATRALSAEEWAVVRNVVATFVPAAGWRANFWRNA